MFTWLKRTLNPQPTNDEVLDAIDEVYSELDEIQVKQKAFEIEIWELVDGRLTPLTKRVSSRMRRAQEEELKEEAPIKKTGLITLDDVRRRHGYFK